MRNLPPANDRSVLLTFDDGPHSAVTPAVLERLQRHGATAVFFVIGRRVKRAAHVLPQIRAGGHLIGNHSYLHRARFVLADAPAPRFWEYYRDLRRCQAVVDKCAGLRPRLFRPPGGRLTPVTLLVPKLLGLRCVTWSREAGDWRFRTAQEARAGAAVLAATVEPGDVVLLHDDNPCVLDLLDELLPALVARHFNLTSAIDRLR
jgi:peptidoglycan/xylan/chitin deacetylase (PgdA/CDA1 family)